VIESPKSCPKPDDHGLSCDRGCQEVGATTLTPFTGVRDRCEKKKGDSRDLGSPQIRDVRMGGGTPLPHGGAVVENASARASEKLAKGV